MNDNQENDDLEVVFDEDESPADSTKKLREKLKICVEEKQEYLDGWQRAKADLINVKKRLDEEKKAFATYATENLVEDLIPVLESFNMATKNKEVWESAPEGWRKGMEYIHTQLITTLQNHGMQTLDPINEEFDSKVHDPVETVDVNEPEKDHKIIEVVMQGYKIGEKIIRAPKVKVGKFE